MNEYKLITKYHLILSRWIYPFRVTVSSLKQFDFMEFMN